ncbi:MAG: winged helix-turn-helix domain-containing protein [Pirellulales bacterium]
MRRFYDYRRRAIMATSMIGAVEQIGETAGAVWRVLDDQGPISLTKLIKLVDLPRDQVMQAIGWLARESKIEIEDNSRGRTIALRS